MLSSLSRRILGILRNTYESLGLVCHTSVGNFFSSNADELKQQAWDAPLPHELTAKRKRWKTDLLENMVVVRRAPALYKEHFNAMELSVFGDANGRGIAVAVHTFFYQDKKI